MAKKKPQLEFDFVKEFLPFCECGCGERVNENYNPNIINRYLPRHHTRDPKCRKQMSDSAKLKYENHPELIENLRQKGIERMSDPIYREHISQEVKATYQEPDVFARISKQRKEIANKPAHRKMLSDRMIHAWQDPEIAKKYLDGMNQTPNNFEIDFDNATPGILRFTGDRSWWRNLPNGKHKNPDFKVTGMNKVVELFGDYWHRNDDPNELISLFAEIGFECMVIWESEWHNNREEMLEKVMVFINE